MDVLIEAVNLVKEFGEKRALNELSFTVKPASAFGLLGRNGAGKTTCIRIIMDVFPADSGSVLINGKTPRDCTLKIGYLPEERGLYPKRTVIEQMVYLGELRGVDPKDAKINAGVLLEKLEASEYTDKKLDTLSKGNQQKIQLAISLINDPDIIILDEPFSGLDPVNAKMLKMLVNEQVELGKTVIFSSHQMPAVEEFCDEICIIDKGSAVISGSLREIKRGYPRNRVYIEAEDENIDIGQVIMQHIDVVSHEKKGSGCILKLKDPALRHEMLKIAEAQNIDISAFYVAEPSLEEIFIEKVGGESEAV